MRQQHLTDSNVKLAFHIHKASASIDVKRQLDDFDSHERSKQLREKYKHGRIWGGTAEGSVGYRTSPNKWRVNENMKLPPLHTKSVFQDVASNTIMSNLQMDMPEAYDTFRSRKSTKQSQGFSKHSDFIGVEELVPATAVSYQSQQSMDSTHNSIRLQVKSKKNGSVPASEFEKQLARLKQKDDTILKARETSDHLVQVVLASSRWL